jgi:hypothetical protein
MSIIVKAISGDEIIASGIDPSPLASVPEFITFHIA